MIVIQILIVRKHKVKEKELERKRQTVVEVSRIAMNVLVNLLCEQELDKESKMCADELVRYIRDDLLECLALGELPEYGIIRAHPYIVLKYPEIFEEIEKCAGYHVKALWNWKKGMGFELMNQGSENDGKRNGSI